VTYLNQQYISIVSNKGFHQFNWVLYKYNITIVNITNFYKCRVVKINNFVKLNENFINLTKCIVNLTKCTKFEVWDITNHFVELNGNFSKLKLFVNL
jgi:hypothetical protein